MIEYAERRLADAVEHVSSVRQELAELRAQLDAAKQEERQFAFDFGSGSRKPSEHWAAILNYMLIRSPNPTAIDEIMAFAEQNDIRLKRSAVRVQLHHYAQRGLVERVGDGLYLPTDSAKIYCDY